MSTADKSTTPATTPGTSAASPFVPPPPSKQYELPPSLPPGGPAEAGPRRLEEAQTSFEAPKDAPIFPLIMPGQKFALINIAGPGNRPKHLRPAFRILGIFPSRKELVDHAAKHFGSDFDCSLWLAQLHVPTILCSTTAGQKDQAAQEKHWQVLEKLHLKAAEKRDKEFRTTVDDAKSGKTLQSEFAQKIRAEKAGKKSTRIPALAQKFKQDTKGMKKTAPLPTSASILEQKSVAVVILEDIRKKVRQGHVDPEPAIVVLAAFKEESDCISYGKYTASKKYPMCNIDVVDMYTWLFPEDVNPEELKEVYGSEKLDDIMQGRKDNVRQTAAYTEYCREQKTDVPMVDLAPPEKETTSQPSKTSELSEPTTTTTPRQAREGPGPGPGPGPEGPDGSGETE